MKMLFDPVFVARLYKFVREAGANRGQRVEAIIHWCGGTPGESWCCYFATKILDICFQGNSPIPREGSCQVVYDLCEKNDWLTGTPSIGDLFFYINEAGHAHHIGIVTVITPTTHACVDLDGIAGNTSEDGTSSNGTGVFEHAISAKKFAHYPRG